MPGSQEKVPYVESDVANKLKNNTKDADCTCAFNDQDDDKGDVASNSDVDSASQEQIFFGPLSKEEAEQLQREANEETTNSEDLRLFLQVRGFFYLM